MSLSFIEAFFCLIKSSVQHLQKISQFTCLILQLYDICLVLFNTSYQLKFSVCSCIVFLTSFSTFMIVILSFLSSKSCLNFIRVNFQKLVMLLSLKYISMFFKFFFLVSLYLCLHIILFSHLSQSSLNGFVQEKTHTSQPSHGFQATFQTFKKLKMPSCSQWTSGSQNMLDPISTLRQSRQIPVPQKSQSIGHIVHHFFPPWRSWELGFFFPIYLC